MRQDSWDLGRWGRIPVSMHWTVLLSFAWLYLFVWDLLATLIASVAFFALLVAHEFGHVFVLRRRKIPVVGIMLSGIHGETAYGMSAKPLDEILVAWGGVGAQLAILVAALAVGALVDFSAIPYGTVIAGPMLLVLIKINIFLMIIALLPIGPFDGHAAWKALPRMRSALRRRPSAPRPPRAQPVVPSPEEQRELDASSAKAAAELIARVKRKSDAPTEDA